MRVFPWALKSGQPDYYAPIGTPLGIYRQRLADFPRRAFLNPILRASPNTRARLAECRARPLCRHLLAFHGDGRQAQEILFRRSKPGRRCSPCRASLSSICNTAIAAPNSTSRATELGIDHSRDARNSISRTTSTARRRCRRRATSRSRRPLRRRRWRAPWHRNVVPGGGPRVAPARHRSLSLVSREPRLHAREIRRLDRGDAAARAPNSVSAFPACRGAMRTTPEVRAG